MPDCDYRLDTQTVRKCGNGIRLTGGTLAGSSLTMLQAFRNLVSIGLSVEEAPPKNIDNRGRLSRADRSRPRYGRCDR